MILITKDRISNIVITRNLNIVAENDIINLCGVSNNALYTYMIATSDKSTLTYFCLRTKLRWRVRQPSREGT